MALQRFQVGRVQHEVHLLNGGAARLRVAVGDRDRRAAALKKIGVRGLNVTSKRGAWREVRRVFG